MKDRKGYFRHYSKKTKVIRVRAGIHDVVRAYAMSEEKSIISATEELLKIAFMALGVIGPKQDKVYERDVKVAELAKALAARLRPR